MNNNLDSIPKTAIVILHVGAFGGAPKRFCNLFLYLNKQYPGRFYLFVNEHLFRQLQEIYGELPDENIRVIKIPDDEKYEENHQVKTPRYFADNIEDPHDIHARHNFLRKIYWYYKNKFVQKNIFKKIDHLREELDIKVFYAVFAGVLPLVFYLDQNPRKAAVIFSDMDSWFTEVHSDMKMLWYRKYYSFNYALENCDLIDFLSPYVAEGVNKLGVNLKESSVRISPCSFIDYSKCEVGDKSKFEIAFSSRLEPEKNPMLYLEAAKVILKKYPDIKFHILGEGTLVNEIRSFIDNNDFASSVNFQFHKNPPEILKNTSVFVSLQAHTNYPSQSVLEAMACGNAIIASDRGDTKLFINNENGILIDLNKDELISALEKLINDPQLAHNMGTKGREFATNNHTIEKFSEYFLGLVREAEG